MQSRVSEPSKPGSRVRKRRPYYLRISGRGIVPPTGLRRQQANFDAASRDETPDCLAELRHHPADCLRIITEQPVVSAATAQVIRDGFIEPGPVMPYYAALDDAKFIPALRLDDIIRVPIFPEGGIIC